MTTTVTIDEETQAKLGDLKLLLREMGDPEFFKTDIVRNLVDDLHGEVRDAYYEAQAEPHLRARRYERHAALLDYWTRDRILDELVHDGYREEYAEAYGDAGDARYVRDVRDTLIDAHAQLADWFAPADADAGIALVPSQYAHDNAVVVATDSAGDPSVWAVTVTSGVLFAPYYRGLGNACEIAFQRTQTLAREALAAAGCDAVDNPRVEPHLFASETINANG